MTKPHDDGPIDPPVQEVPDINIDIDLGNILGVFAGNISIGDINLGDINIGDIAVGDIKDNQLDLSDLLDIGGSISGNFSDWLFG
ncbi:hypothetical protein BKE38_11455 [Pseudoroseomonas deserti]|uniref:Uncharacterized protein n=1 Tax=Teichococcus deserti TaxID=1817963 RepID=A0A1V2H2Y6_9PROT|nr:hypothetical protein [Pseudoroseomonas deserti]ONG53777.1 hypothetical protein BKE38_11455 [Pseudoroseomonas deserti]